MECTLRNSHIRIYQPLNSIRTDGRQRGSERVAMTLDKGLVTFPCLHAYLLEEEVVGQVVEDHGVGGVNGVGFGEQLHPLLDGLMLLGVELQDGQPHQRPHTLGAQLQGTLESQLRLLYVPQLHKAQTHAQTH